MKASAINRFAGTNKDTQRVTGANLQFAGPLVVAVDLQQVVDVDLYLWHLFLLQHDTTDALVHVTDMQTTN